MNLPYAYQSMSKLQSLGRCNVPEGNSLCQRRTRGGAGRRRKAPASSYRTTMDGLRTSHRRPMYSRQTQPLWLLGRLQSRLGIRPLERVSRHIQPDSPRLRAPNEMSRLSQREGSSCETERHPWSGGSSADVERNGVEYGGRIG